jgi:hypothetical protein
MHIIMLETLELDTHAAQALAGTAIMFDQPGRMTYTRHTQVWW